MNSPRAGGTSKAQSRGLAWPDGAATAPPALTPPRHTEGEFCPQSGSKPIKHRGAWGDPPPPPQKRASPGKSELSIILMCVHLGACHRPTPPVHSRLRFSLEIKITLVRRCCGFFPRLNAETADECRLSRGPLAGLEAGEFLWSFSRFSQAENRQGEHKSKGRHSG